MADEFPIRSAGPTFEDWMGPPPNELGTSVPLNLVCIETQDVVVYLLGAVSYSTGIEFQLSVLVRPGSELMISEGNHRGRVVTEPHALVADVLEWGIEFSDGRRVTSSMRIPPWLPQEADPLHHGFLHLLAGRVSASRRDERWWLWPLPPPGRLSLSVNWSATPQPATAEHVLDSEKRRTAASDARELWPHRGGGQVSMFDVFLDYATSSRDTPSTSPPDPE